MDSAKAANEYLLSIRCIRIAPRQPLLALTLERPLLQVRDQEPQEEELFQLPPA